MYTCMLIVLPCFNRRIVHISICRLHRRCVMSPWRKKFQSGRLPHLSPAPWQVTAGQLHIDLPTALSCSTPKAVIATRGHPSHQQTSPRDHPPPAAVPWPCCGVCSTSYHLVVVVDPNPNGNHCLAVAVVAASIARRNGSRRQRRNLRCRWTASRTGLSSPIVNPKLSGSTA